MAKIYEGASEEWTRRFKWSLLYDRMDSREMTQMDEWVVKANDILQNLGLAETRGEAASLANEAWMQVKALQRTLKVPDGISPDMQSIPGLDTSKKAGKYPALHAAMHTRRKFSDACADIIDTKGNPVQDMGLIAKRTQEMYTHVTHTFQAMLWQMGMYGEDAKKRDIKVYYE